MATRFVDEATAQLAPIYQQQEQAVAGQVPSINKLFDILVQGLEGQRQTETQNILESASARGVLRSSLPVDLQTALGQALLGQRGQLEAQRAEQIGGVNKSLADIGLAKTQGIFSLADVLQQADLREREFQMSQEAAREAARLAAAESARDASAEDGDLSDVDAYATQLLSGVVEVGDIPKNIRGKVLARADDIAKEQLEKGKSVDINKARESGGLTTPRYQPRVTAKQVFKQFTPAGRVLSGAARGTTRDVRSTTNFIRGLFAGG